VGNADGDPGSSPPPPQLTVKNPRELRRNGEGSVALRG